MYRIYKKILHSFPGDFKNFGKKWYILEEFYGSFPGASRMIREVSHVCVWHLLLMRSNYAQTAPSSLDLTLMTIS